MHSDTQKHILDPCKDALKQILAEVIELRLAIEVKANQRLQKYPYNNHSGVFSNSASNLAHYLAMRQFDLRHLQDRLSHASLSSLGRAEGSVLSTLDSLIDILQRATDPHYVPDEHSRKLCLTQGQQLLDQHTIELFGPFRKHGRAHVMVTLPSEASWDYTLVKSMLEKGMSCARINCAHDDATIWQDMINNIRRAETELSHSCRILMDLAGQKIRTSNIALGPAIHHLRAQKDRTGKVVVPAHLVLTTDYETCPVDNSLFRVSIPKALHKKLKPGISLAFVDKQHKQRYLKVDKALSDTDWLVSCDKSA